MQQTTSKQEENEQQNYNFKFYNTEWAALSLSLSHTRTEADRDRHILYIAVWNNLCLFPFNCLCRVEMIYKRYYNNSTLGHLLCLHGLFKWTCQQPEKKPEPKWQQKVPPDRVCVCVYSVINKCVCVLESV